MGKVEFLFVETMLVNPGNSFKMLLNLQLGSMAESDIAREKIFTLLVEKVVRGSISMPQRKSTIKLNL